jgi:hypothetical protein
LRGWKDLISRLWNRFRLRWSGLGPRPSASVSRPVPPGVLYRSGGRAARRTVAYFFAQ